MRQIERTSRREPSICDVDGTSDGHLVEEDVLRGDHVAGNLIAVVEHAKDVLVEIERHAESKRVLGNGLHLFDGLWNAL